MFPLGLSSFCADSVNEETIKEYAEKGVKYMEISVSPEECISNDWGEIRRCAEKHGVILHSFHLPYYPFEICDISEPDREKQAAAIAHHEKMLKFAAEAGVKIAVIHPSGEPYPENEREERLQNAKQALGILGKKARELGLILAVEDLPRTCLGHDSEEMKYLVSDDENLFVCFDTNHLLTEAPEDFIHALGDKIITLHVSDYDFVNERHWLPFEGKVNWNKVLEALKDINYNGIFMYEVKRSIEEIKENYKKFK